MSNDDFWSEPGRSLRDLIGQAMSMFTTQGAQLNASELQALGILAARLWSYIDAEQHPSMANTADSPVWSAISQLGIVVYPETISFRGRDVTLWAWSIPEFHIALGKKGGMDTKIDALKAALQVFDFALLIAIQEQQAMLEADLATFQTWKALKQQAGTWTYPYNPVHPDERGANTKEDLNTEDETTH